MTQVHANVKNKKGTKRLSHPPPAPRTSVAMRRLTPKDFRFLVPYALSPRSS
jgi:hypothetical protein